nr:immunoglobulin heavy chain junction region [Macaca mulatta]
CAKAVAGHIDFW